MKTTVNELIFDRTFMFLHKDKLKEFIDNSDKIVLHFQRKKGAHFINLHANISNVEELLSFIDNTLPFSHKYKISRTK